jgi:alkylation response protein AidB-like acyl-CoA dehydrogenase
MPGLCAADLEMIEAARDLGPAIDAAADAIEQAGHLTEPLVSQLRDAGVFAMYVPKEVGGREVHPVAAFHVAEALARHDGSVGWCAQVSAAVATLAAWIDPAGLQSMAERSGSLHFAGSARVLGHAEAVPGGFRARGHWDYASGVSHANWYLGACHVEERNGERRSRSLWLPVDEGTIAENWAVVGLRGTGSHDFIVDDVFVPTERVVHGHWIKGRYHGLYDPRLAMTAAWAPTAGVAVGLAQGAIDALTEIGGRSSTTSPVPLRARVPVQEVIGRAEAITSGCRAFAVEAFSAVMDAVAEDRGDIARAVARAQAAITHAMNEAVRVVDLCFHAAGTNAISTGNRLERFLRDAHTAVQHAAGQAVHFQAAGATLLGATPAPIDFSGGGPRRPVG